MMSTPTALGYSTTFSRPDVPPIRGEQGDKPHATACRTFLDSGYRYETAKRAELERGWNRARLYDASKQWLRPLLAWGGNRFWFAWEPALVSGRNDKYPRPVRNLFSPCIQDEVSRLIGVGSRPYVRLDDPEKEDGAVLARQVMTDRHERYAWETKNRRGSYTMALFGQWIHMSRILSDRLAMPPGPVLGALKCRACGASLASREITGQQALEHQGAARQVFGEQPSWEIASCPRCGGDLQEFAPDRKAWEGQSDLLGRPMSQPTPTIIHQSEVLLPYSFFPGNQGVGYEVDDNPDGGPQMEECWLRVPRTLEYFRRYYERGREVQKNDRYELFRHHPVFNGVSGLTIGAEGVWDNHNMEDIYVGKPSMDFPRGRLIVMAGEQLLVDDELFFKDTEIPRVDVRVAQWEVRAGEIWGKPLSEDLYSPQDNVNATLSLAMDIQGKYVNPKVILHKGMDLQFTGGSRSPYSGDIWTLDTRGLDPSIANRYPFLFGHQGPPNNVWEMIDRDKAYFQDAGGARDAEIGNVSGVELNYSALLFSAQKSATRRKPRQSSIRSLKKAVWSYELRYVSSFVDDKTLLHYRDDSNAWAVKTFRGFELQNQTDVGLEDEPVVDSGTAIRASIAEARAYGTLKISAEGGSYATDRKINRAIGVPEDLNEDRNLQYDLSLQEWKDWVDEKAPQEPAIDPFSNDHALHFATHTLSIEGSREAKDLLKRLKTEVRLPWQRVLRLTWEWQRTLQELEQKVARVKNMPDPQSALVTLVRTGVPEAQAAQQVQQMVQMVEMDALATQNFPPSLEMRIYGCWCRLIEAADPLLIGVGDWIEKATPLYKLLRFNAHRLGHYLLATGYVSADAVVPQPAAVQAGPAAPPSAPPEAAAAPAAPA
jgi:hypothetical protein